MSTTGYRLLVNLKESIQTTTSRNKQRTLYVEISKRKINYYFSILFNNKLTVPVKINCVYNKVTKIFELNANEMKKKFQVALQSKDAPDPMNCTSSSINPGIKPILNGKTASIIIPNIDINSYKKIDVTLPIDTYYISLVVTNLINTNVNLKWNGSKRNGIEVIPQKAKNKTVIILFTTKTDIKLFAMSTTGYKLLVNLKESIQTTTSRNKQRTLYVEISKRKINYYFSILFNNKLTVPVKINCVYYKVTKIFELNANEMKKKFQVALQSKDAPDPMNCTSSSINPGIKPILNGKTASIIIPNIDIKSYKKIDVTLPIDTYYISLVVTNLINTNVNLKWNGSKRNGIEVIPQKAKKKTMIILFTTKTDIKLFAMSTTGYRLLVNLKESIQTTTSRNKQRTLYVEISKRKVNYYFSILFNNNLTVPVKINCVYNKVTKIFELNANEMKKKFQVALQSKDAPDPMNCTSSSINPGIKPILNGKTASIIIPNIDIKSYKKIDVTLPIDTYYISLVVTNLINTNVNLKWNGSKRNGIELIPQNAKNKTVIILFTTKTDIKLFAINTTGYRLLVNLQESMQTTTFSDKEHKIYIEISSNDYYYYSILVESRLHVPVKLNCVYYKIVKSFEVMSNELNKKFQVAMQSNRSPEPMICTASSIEPGVKPIINGQASAKINPKLDSNKYTKLVVTYPEGLYYIRLLVTNLINSTVNLNWNSTKRNDVLIILRNMKNKNVVLVFIGKTDITLFAVSNGGLRLFVNSEKSLQVTSSPDKQRITYIEIGTGEMYFSFNVENSELYEATVKWIFNGKKRSLKVRGLKSKALSFKTKNRLEPIVLTAYRDWRMKAMYLNNNYTFRVYPKTTEKPYTYILLSMFKKSIIKLKYLKLSVTNLVQSDVKLSVDNHTRIIKINAINFKVLLSFDSSIVNYSLAKVSAFVPNGNSKVYVNKKNVVYIMLKETKEPSRTVILSDYSK